MVSRTPAAAAVVGKRSVLQSYIDDSDYQTRVRSSKITPCDKRKLRSATPNQKLGKNLLTNALYYNNETSCSAAQEFSSNSDLDGRGLNCTSSALKQKGNDLTVFADNN